VIKQSSTSCRSCRAARLNRCVRQAHPNRRHPVCLITAAGKAHTVKGLGNGFARNAGGPALIPIYRRTIRNYGAVRCAAADASEQQIMSTTI
jgi:hypothetical protein